MTCEGKKSFLKTAKYLALLECQGDVGGIMLCHVKQWCSDVLVDG